MRPSMSWSITPSKWTLHSLFLYTHAYFVACVFTIQRFVLLKRPKNGVHVQSSKVFPIEISIYSKNWSGEEDLAKDSRRMCSLMKLLLYLSSVSTMTKKSILRRPLWIVRSNSFISEKSNACRWCVIYRINYWIVGTLYVNL